VVAHIAPGDLVVTKTVCTDGRDDSGERITEPGNPLTGPFHIEGAEPGDSISVKLSKVRCNRDWGFSSFRLGLVSMTPEHVEKVYPNEYIEGLVRPGVSSILPWDIDRERLTARPRRLPSESKGQEFAIKPMLGCIGVAPAGDFAPTSGPSGAYGGNIDYNEICEGATVHLPVYQPGALLYVGDGHALQGDGEPLGTGIETSMDVEFSVDLNKGKTLNGVRVENATHIISVGSQPEFSSSMNRGLQMATSDMVRWLVDDYRMEEWAAHMLIGMVGRYDVVTVLGSMALRVPRESLP
jgi:acetamidase/formamidase